MRSTSRPTREAPPSDPCLMKQLIKQALLLKHQHAAHRGYQRLYNRICTEQPILRQPAPGEQEWLEKWHTIDPHVKPTAYRIFQHYVGTDTRILPLETCLACFEPVLNPIELRPYYSDKNMFDRIFGAEHTLGALLRQIDGVYYTADYRPVALDDSSLRDMLEGYTRVFVKPSVDGESGRGVRQFVCQADGTWCDGEGEQLNVNYLNTHYRGNIVVQESFEQHSYLAQFNPTSVNTLRIFALRLPSTGECVVPGIVLRIGGKGAIVDNAHSGGRFVGVNPDGTLGHYACDFLGRTVKAHNGIDFSTGHYQLPHYDEIVRFAREMGSRILHHHILAFDVCLNTEGRPRVIEVNIHGFGGWVFQFCGQPTFGAWTDEIIDWCRTRRPRRLAMI